MHKNWDNLREHRIYGYMNLAEFEHFQQAINLTGKQQATCVREFLLAQSDIIINRNKKNHKPPTVNYQFPDRYFTVQY